MRPVPMAGGIQLTEALFLSSCSRTAVILMK